MKKRIALILAITLLALSLFAACQSAPSGETSEPATTGESKSEEETTESQSTEPEKEETKEAEKEDDGILVKMDEINYVYEKSKEPDEEGNFWGRMMFQNNSKYPIRRFSAQYKDKENDSTFEANEHLTVMPGKISTEVRFSITGDPELRAYEYVVFKDGKNYRIKNNVKTGYYSQEEEYEIDRYNVPNKEVHVSADQLAYEYTTAPPDSLGSVFSTLKMVNKSEHTIKNYFLTMYLPEKDTTVKFAHTDTPIAPGQAFPESTTFGGKELIPYEIQYTVEVKGKEYTYNYDYQLDRYTSYEHYAQ